MIKTENSCKERQFTSDEKLNEKSKQSEEKLLLSKIESSKSQTVSESSISAEIFETGNTGRVSHNGSAQFESPQRRIPLAGIGHAQKMLDRHSVEFPERQTITL